MSLRQTPGTSRTWERLVNNLIERIHHGHGQVSSTDNTTSDFLDLGSKFTTALSSVAGTASDIDLDKAVSAFHDILLDGTILLRFL